MARRSSSDRTSNASRTCSATRELDDLAFEVVLGLGLQALVPSLPRSSRRLGPHDVDGTAVDRGHEEGSERAATGVEPLGVLPQLEEDLLHQLLGQGPVAQDTHREAEGGVAVAAVHLGQRRLAEPGDGDDQRGVAGVAELGFHHCKAYGAARGSGSCLALTCRP